MFKLDQNGLNLFELSANFIDLTNHLIELEQSSSNWFKLN